MQTKNEVTATLMPYNKILRQIMEFLIITGQCIRPLVKQQ